MTANRLTASQNVPKGAADRGRRSGAASWRAAGGACASTSNAGPGSALSVGSGDHSLHSLTPVQYARAAYLACLGALCWRMGVDLKSVLDLDVRTHVRGAAAPAGVRDCARARCRAVYLAVTVVALRQADVARAVGVTPAAVCLACQRVEDERDDPQVNALLEVAAREVLKPSEPQISFEQVLARATRPTIGA